MNGASGIFTSQAARKCSRKRCAASTGEILSTLSAAFGGRIGAVRSTPAWDNQDFADATSRLATSAPRFCARGPVTEFGAASHGTAMEPAGKSDEPGIVGEEGGRGRAQELPVLRDCERERVR